MRYCRNFTRILFLLTAVISVSVSGLQPLLAQEPQIDEGGYKLTLGEVPEFESGKAALMSGNTNADGDKFFLEHLTMFQPVTVYLIAADPSRPVQMNLAKHRYGEIAWSGNTSSDGTLAHSFRTQGELKIHVTPVDKDGEAAYGLIVWAADLPGPDQTPPVILASAADEPGGMPLWLMLLAGVVLVSGVGFVFFKLGRRS